MSGSRGIAVVTCGAGFICGHMVDLLVEEGFRVHVLDNLTGGRLLNLDHHRSNTEVIFEKTDMCSLSEDDPLFHGARYVFHFAGIGDIVPSIEHPQSVNRLASLLGGARVHVPKRPGEPDRTWAGIRRISAELGRSPQIRFEDGVNIMLQNIQYWREAPVWDAPAIEAATKAWFNFLSRKAFTT